jgi:putative secretion ATPase (PEP-CTERM system associated)
MYLEHFQLEHYPFRLTPDPAFLFLSKGHSRAKAYMDYALWQQDSFIVITGEIGSGKTTLIESVLAGMDDKLNVARIHQTQLDEEQFLQAVLLEFGFKPFKYGKVQLLNVFRDYLRAQHAKGRRVMLVIDEAQNLSPRVLEEIRLLSGLETHKEKLINVLLVGQPELNETLDSPGLEQLAQRVRLRFHIKPLNREEIREYIEHRVAIAGSRADALFCDEIYDFVYKYTGGIPRLINLLCDTALMGAFVEDKEKVAPDVLEAAIEELQWTPHEDKPAPIQRDRLQLSPTAGVPPKLIVTRDGELIGEYLLDRRTTLIGRPST